MYNGAMQRLPVESSDIVSIGYDPADKILEVEFQGGRVYHYRDVDADIYAQFMRADSYGTFFFAHINGRYRYEKVATDGVAAQLEKPLVFVSGNEADLHDLQVACEPYGIEIESLEVPLDEIQSDNAEDIAIKKAKQAYKLAEQPVIVSTQFWSVLALHGFPGAYAEPISRWLSAEDLLQLMADKSDRTISLTRTAAYYDGKRHKTFTQEYIGTIADEPLGEGSVLEQLVVLHGQDKTLAELHSGGLISWPTPEASAWRSLAKWLRLQRRFI